jgi:hypothetical protein
LDFPKKKLAHDLDLRDFYFKSYVFRSLYHDQLHRWLRLFPRRQLKIMQSERFFENEADTMSEAADFLGLKEFDFQTADEVKRSWDAGAGNASDMPLEYPAMDDATREVLSRFFEPYNQQLYRLIHEDFGWN